MSSTSSLRNGLMAFAVGAAVALGASSAQAATIIWNLDSPAGVLPLAGQSYTAGGVTISAAGFLNANFSSPNLQLFGKTGGGDETGLGSNVDPSGENELNGSQWIQINFTAARAAGVTGFDFVMDSTTGTEAWRVFGSNSATSLGSQIMSPGGIGNDEGVTHDFTGTDGAFAFYNFQATAGNVLVASVSGVSAVPEPSTWAMMLIGFAGLGFAFRQSRRRVSMA
jgi:PEP-CTERM motif